MSKMVDKSIIGMKFGRLTVVEFSHIKNKHSYWKCKCECGNEKVVYRGGLTSGDYISCGCYKREHNHEFGYKHGQSNTRIYKLWSTMIQRVTNPKHDRYYSYGGRGVEVCDDWLYDFEKFYNWSIENGYSDELTIDRINNDGNYEPNNCRWIKMTDQYENKQNSKLITYRGKTQSRSRWAKELGVSPETLRYRLNIAKWTVEEAFRKTPNFESLPYAEEFLIN